MRIRKAPLNELVIGKKSILSGRIAKGIKKSEKEKKPVIRLPLEELENILAPSVVKQPVLATFEKEVTRYGEKRKVKEKVVLIPLKNNNTLELTPKEYEALLLMAKGIPNRTIEKKINLNLQRIKRLRREMREIPSPIVKKMREEAKEKEEEEEKRKDYLVQHHATGWFRRRIS